VEHNERIPTYEFLIGSSTWTEHKEFGYRYRLDLSEVFFSGRLSTERRRVNEFVKSEEKVLVPFCGVGPFVIPAADKGASVVAVENNSAALHWLNENLVLNHVSDRVRVLSEDAFSIPRLVDTQFDRVICPTPYGYDEILDILTPLVKDGGMFHFYTFKKEHQLTRLIDEFKKKGLVCQFYHRCGYVAPGVSRYVFDLQKIG
jgi:tRNA (guanine37-N1)-methyltransferase